MTISKNTLEYWRARLKKRKFTRSNGADYESSEYFINLSISGKQIRFNLESANKEVAADKALEIWHYLKANGGTATLKKFKTPVDLQVNDPTFGQFFAEIEKLGIYEPRTFTSYKRKLRGLIAGALNVRSSANKFDHTKGGHLKWQAKVDAVKMSKLTPIKVLEWRARCLAAVAHDPILQKQAHITATSTIRNSKALFKPDCIRHLPFENLQNPFDGIKSGSATTRRYRSNTDYSLIIQDAVNELASARIPKVSPFNPGKFDQDREDALSKREQFKNLDSRIEHGAAQGRNR